LNGAIEITRITPDSAHPAFVYDPKTDRIRIGLDYPGIAVLAVDNLPCEMPAESSREFSEHIRDYVYQIAVHGVTDIADHYALPREIRNAVITQNGRLTRPFRYLDKYL